MLQAVLTTIPAIFIFYCTICFLIAYGFAASNRVPVTTEPDIAYENVSFHSYLDGVLLSGWYIPANSSNTIIAMHGGKQNRSQLGIGLIDICMAFNKQGYSILTFDRRGCGQSESSKLNASSCLDRDFAGAINFIRLKKGKQENIFLWGTSIGAVAALSCAAKLDNVSAVVADSCFANIPEMAGRMLKKTFPAFIIFKAGSIFMGRQFMGMENNNPIDNACHISCPILYISGTRDPTIPKEDNKRLLVASKNPASQMWIVKGAAHSQSFITAPKEYVDKVVSFLQMSIKK